MSAEAPRPRTQDARARLLAAATDLIRRQGFTATSVEALCAAAGVTKGAFFHHFPSKEALGVAAAQNWAATTSVLFAGAPYHAPADPFDRVLAYLDFRDALIDGPLAAFTCLVGTMAQEVYDSAPAIREACAASITGHAATLVPDFAAVIAARGAPPGVTAEGLALLTQTVLQGGFVVAKATGDPAVAREAVAHLRRYLILLFAPEKAPCPTPPNTN